MDEEAAGDDRAGQGGNRDPGGAGPGWRPGDRWPSQFKNAVRVSVEEAAALQGFRTGYPWQGSRTRCFLQIGNAVCPPVAHVVVAAISCHSMGQKGPKR